MIKIRRVSDKPWLRLMGDSIARVSSGVFVIISIGFVVSISSYANGPENSNQEERPMKIITIFDDETSCLSKKAEVLVLSAEGLKEAQTIANQLITSLTPLMPAAGLAAPQIGISKQVFIYSWDRSIENIEVVINPKIILFSPETHTSWEACFSTIQENNISQAALLTRAKSLIVEYFNLKGELVKRKLEGFAAKVFQHEYDHLQGIENVRKEGAELKAFATKSELVEFMKKIKQNDSVSYIQPMDMEG